MTAHVSTGEPDATGAQQGRKLVGIAIGIPILVAVMLSLFAWPAANTAPRDLPIGLVAPDAIASSLEAGLGRVVNDGEPAFEVHTYASEEVARAAISNREVYGAFVIGPSGPTVLTASAASPLVAQLLQQAAGQLAAAPGGATQQPQVVDVVPADSDDPRGAVLGSAVLPLVLSGLALGSILALATRPGGAQALTLIIASALVGLVVVGIAQGWLEALGGDWWVNASVLGLTILAISAGVAGLGAVFGLVGIGLGAAVMMLLGNPLSAIASAPEMLPTWAGVTGQLLPPGAGGSLLRSVAFFDGAAAGRPLLVLSLWAGVGLILVMAGGLLKRSRPRMA